MWPWGKKEEKSIGATSTRVVEAGQSLSDLLSFGRKNAVTPTGALQLYEDSTAVSIPINYIADPFASLTPVIKEKDGSITTEDPVLDLLKRPSPFFTQNLFLKNLAVNYLVTGETEIAALGSVKRQPVEIQPMSPKNVSVTRGPGGFVHNMIVSDINLPGTYVLQVVNRQARYYDGNMREIFQIRDFSTQNNSLVRGQSPLVSASAEARQHIFGSAHNVSVLEKGGKMQLVFHFEEGATDAEEFAELQSKVRDQYGGPNGEALGVTTGGKMNIQNLGITNRDMDYVNMQNLARLSIALQYKVPLPLLFLDATSLNNYQVAVRALYDDAVLPLADKLFGGLTDMLMPRFGMDPTERRITYNPLDISALMQRTLEQIKLRKDIGIETDNELRDSMGREPYEGGDVIYKPATLIPAGTDLFTDDEEPKVSLDADEDI